jgi:hypothetical protein
MNRSPEHIRSLVIAVIGGNAALTQINELVRLAHEMAIVRLQQYIAKGRTKLLDQGATVTSLALESTAELFARNEDNEFIVLSEYFKDIDAMSPGEVVIALRALIFESLHDSIVQMYQEMDPVYAKIIRTLHRVLPSVKGVRIVERFGDTIVVAEGDEHMELPRTPSDELQRLLAPFVFKAKNLKSALESLPIILAEHEAFAHSCSFLTLAAAIKHVYGQMATNVDVVNADVLGFNVDLHKLLGESYDEFEKWFRQKYVCTEKVQEPLAAAYLAACRDYLTASFVEMNGENKKYWDYLRPHAADVTYTEYRSKHRSVFEYAMNRCMKIARERLKEIV